MDEICYVVPVTMLYILVIYLMLSSLVYTEGSTDLHFFRDFDELYAIVYSMFKKWVVENKVCFEKILSANFAVSY